VASGLVSLGNLVGSSDGNGDDLMVLGLGDWDGMMVLVLIWVIACWMIAHLVVTMKGHRHDTG
jgi:hypothetical protein